MVHVDTRARARVCVAMRVAFAMCDRDADGLISIQEVYDTLSSLGHTVSHRQVKQIIRRVDTDRNYPHLVHYCTRTRGVIIHLSKSYANKIVLVFIRVCFQCFDAVGWAAGRASGL